MRGIAGAKITSFGLRIIIEVVAKIKKGNGLSNLKMARKSKKAMYNNPRVKELYDIGKMYKNEAKTTPTVGFRKVKKVTSTMRSHCQPTG